MSCAVEAMSVAGDSSGKLLLHDVASNKRPTRVAPVTIERNVSLMVDQMRRRLARFEACLIRLFQEVFRARVLGGVEDLLSWAMFDHFATFHEQYVVGDAAEKVHRVGDDEHRVTAIDERPQERTQTVNATRIERARRFVKQK